MRRTPVAKRNEPQKKLLTVSQAAEILSTSEKTVRRIIETRELTVVRIGRSVRILDEDLELFIMQRRGRG